ncbi:metal ABC transporter substrate-binding protein [Longivirga aurantiaca]|uniref:Metal ABC transporter substrate-binding protein n=1 Tax=Longivirga aurantiaca TaxID=1837743 RepID=A0ABW1T5P5_9ACTN
MISRSSRPLLAVLGLGSALLLAACGSNASDAESPGGGTGMVIVTTVAPITSIAANIVGDRAQVVGIVPEGTNSHTFDPPPQVAATMEKADIVFVNGLQLEEPTFQLAEENASNATIVKIGDTVLPESEYIYDFSFPKEDGKPNPHLWTDPTYAIKYAAVIKDTVAAKDPANADYYTTNYEAFVAKATALSDALKKDQTTVPEGGLELLTYHDAYAYFAKTYGWKVIGAVQPSNFEDPQPKEIARLVDQIKAENVPVIFGSEVFPSKVLEQIAAETGARYEDTLRDDDLPGAPGDAEHSWLGLMRYDYVTMIQGLGGTTDALDALDVSDVAPDKADYPQ